LTYSSSFDNAAWDKVSSTATANTTISPSGIQDADTIAFSSGGYVGQILTSSGAHSYSVYAKYIGTQWLYVQNYNGNDFGAWFDIQNGVVGTIESGVTASIEQAENGFYRCTITMTASSSSPSYWVFFNTTGNGSFTRTGSSYFWGAQLELGNYVSSYIPTTSASVTRNADVISKTGISSLIGQTEGTLFWEGIGNTQSVGDDLWMFGTFANDTSVAVLLYYIHSTASVSCFINNGSSFVLLDAPMTITDNNKVAIGYKNGDFVIYLNGVAVDSSTSAIAPPSGMNQVAMNKWQGATGVQKQQMKAAALWKTRLTNTQLAELTTI
jgi:hypothetical protein